MTISPETLIEKAETARDNAYNPYSDYAVGVAVEGSNGEMYVGCNVENAAYTPTTHAEQSAIASAVADGVTEFEGLALVTDGRDGGAPCGFCRQVIKEFVDDDFPIYSATDDGYEEYEFGELLPDAFGPEDVLDPDAMQ